MPTPTRKTLSDADVSGSDTIDRPCVPNCSGGPRMAVQYAIDDDDDGTGGKCSKTRNGRRAE
jgi:hypothetical protein